MIKIFEKTGTRKYAEGTAALEFILEGTDNPTAAMAFAESNTPMTHDGKSRQPLLLDEIWADTVNQDGAWTVSVKYGTAPPLSASAFGGSFEFDTSGGTQHLTQSIQTMGRYKKYDPIDRDAPDFKGAIGVTDSGVEGVDVVTGGFKFSVTMSVPMERVTPAYVEKLRALTSFVNNAPFSIVLNGSNFTFAEGELLFHGAKASLARSAKKADFTFSFEAEENVTNLTVGEITGIAKKGWEYLWVRYQDAIDAGAVVKRPMAVYVEKVYYGGNFGDLIP